MSESLEVTMLPAKEGDCLIIGYGESQARKYILIDAGRAWTYNNALNSYLAEHNIEELELLVVTHIDRDHIDGMLKLVDDTDFQVRVKEIWFNTYDHLNGEAVQSPQSSEEIESFGAKMGEELSGGILERGWPWNRKFNGKAVEIDSNDKPISLGLGEVNLTLLAPNREKLEALIPNWEKECKKAGIVPGGTVEEYKTDDDEIEEFGAIDIDELAEEEFQEDSSKPNGTSIAFILEYKNKKILFAGDAHADLLIQGLQDMGATPEAPMKIDGFKVPHHGSKYNVSRELLELMECSHYMVSTNGNYFKHPDSTGMSRMIKFGTEGSTINFNYRSDYTDIWDEAGWQRKYSYSTNYPSDGEEGYLKLRF